MVVGAGDVGAAASVVVTRVGALPQVGLGHRGLDNQGQSRAGGSVVPKSSGSAGGAGGSVLQMLGKESLHHCH